MTPSNDDEREYVDADHPYMKDHDLSEFTWSFDGAGATKFAGELISQVIHHTLECGPDHAINDWSVQAGLVLDDVAEGTMLPVLMLNDGEGNIPVAVLLHDQGKDTPLPLAHTIGMLVTEDGISPALPSRGRDRFGDVDEQGNPTTQEGE